MTKIYINLFMQMKQIENTYGWQNYFITEELLSR